MMANHQKQEMRDHLRVVQEITVALTKDDFDAIASSAARIGWSDQQAMMCKHMGAGAPGERALSMIDIDRPRIDWLAMAQSMGVPAVAVETAEDFYRALADSAREPGPRLIEVRLY